MAFEGLYDKTQKTDSDGGVTGNIVCPNCKGEYIDTTDPMEYHCTFCDTDFNHTEGAEAYRGRFEDDGSDEDEEGREMSPTPREIARNAKYWKHTGETNHE